MAEPQPNINRTINNTLPRSGNTRPNNDPPAETQELKQDPDAPKLKGFILLKALGQGVHAQVWEGIQVRTRRFCAIKVFHQGTGVDLEFLKKEVEKILQLDKHPNIVSLFDVDFTSNPVFYVMDLAQNGSIEKLIKEGDPTNITPAQLAQRVVWLEEIAGALQYVHTKNIIHCDFKPANVLLDDEDHTRVADFGHSRALNESGSALGSLFYMAPEQAYLPEDEQLLAPDARWDIYSFGCTAYAILSGHVPHADIGMDLERTPVIKDRLKIYRKALQNDPVMDLHTLTKGRVDQDLSAIIEKCMKVNPAERYKTMAEVMKDLKNRREGKPVSPLAHIPSYWMKKFIRRYKVTLLASTAAVIAILAASLMAHHHQQSQAANRAFDDILRGREFLDKEDQASAVLFFTESNRIDPTALARGDAYLNMPPIPAQVLVHKAELRGLAFSRNGENLVTAGEKSGLKLWDLSGKELKAIKTRGDLRVFALSPENTLAAVGDSYGEVKFLNLQNGKLSTALSGSAITAVAFSPDDKKMFAASSDGSAQVFNTKTVRPQHNVFKNKTAFIKAVFDREGRKLVTLNQDGIARVWDAEGANTQGDPMTISFKGAPAWYTPDIAYSRDGRTILISDWDGLIHFFDRDGHRQGKINLEGTGAHFCLDPSGHKLLTSVIAQGTGQARLWTLKDKKPSKFTIKHSGRILSLSFSRDGQRFLTAGVDRTARIWDSSTGKASELPLWHGDSVTCAALNEDGSLALTCGKDRFARLWDLNTSGIVRIPLLWKKSPHPSYKKTQTKSLLSPDGKRLLTYGGGSGQLWDTETGKNQGRGLANVQSALFDPSGNLLLTANGQQIRLFELKTSNSSILSSKGAKTLAFSGNGATIAAGGTNNEIHLFDPKDPKKTVTLTGSFKAAVLSLDAQAKGLLAQSTSGALAYYSLPAAEADKPLLKISKGVDQALLSSDDRFLLVLSNGTVKVYDASNGKQQDKPLKQTHAITWMALSPDDHTLVTLDRTGLGDLWDLGSRSTLGSPLRHEGRAKLARFSPGGDGLAVAYANDDLQFWDAKSGEPIGVAISLDGAKSIFFRNDGKDLIWLDKGGNLRTIDTSWLSASDDPKRLIQQAEVAAQCSLGSHNSVDPMDPEDWHRLWGQFEKH